jgi:hypothetical protein
LNVFLFNYAGLPDNAIRSLEQRTGQILAQAGIGLQWIRCGGPDAGPKCAASLESADVILRIAASCPDKASSGEVLGSAVTPGNYISLCAARVHQIEQDNGLDYGSVMPYAAAHEMGHLLLGGSHGASGVMRAVWGRPEFSAMERLRLNFSPREAEAMRNAVSRAGVSTASIPARPD